MRARIFFIVLVLLLCGDVILSQAILKADGPGDTYELITSVLAPNGNPVENPECAHPEFGRHIAEVWDSVLSQYVFEFYSHVTPDNDRCIKFDRQRVEIKTYDKSPDSLLGVVGETVTYNWKFKLPAEYQPSTSFTHIHQIKAVGGDDGMPIITLTPRKASPNRMELIHDNTTKVAKVDLSLFEDEWVECSETIYIHPVDGTYSITIERISDGTTILSYYKDGIMTIRSDNDFIRPKWGIYRSLNHPDHLRDEAVRFADISIQEGSITGIKSSDSHLMKELYLSQNYPNPFNPATTINYTVSTKEYIELKVYNILGKEIAVLANEVKPSGKYYAVFNGSHFPSGIYFYTLKNGKNTISRKMILLK